MSPYGNIGARGMAESDTNARKESKEKEKIVLMEMNSKSNWVKSFILFKKIKGHWHWLKFVERKRKHYYGYREVVWTNPRDNAFSCREKIIKYKYEYRLI